MSSVRTIFPWLHANDVTENGYTLMTLRKINEGLSRNFKTRRTNNDYNSWKELVEMSKIVKFGKDRFTNCEDMNFQKSKFYMKTFGNLRLEATPPTKVFIQNFDF